jgi:serine/threonine-protein kinase RsbT
MTESVQSDVYSRWRATSDAVAPQLRGRPWPDTGARLAGSPGWPLPDESEAEPSALTARIVIGNMEDIVVARHAGRLLAQSLRFPSSRTTLITTAISELARNIVLYAGFGEIALSRVWRRTLTGVQVAALDDGPGIEDVQCILAGGYSTSGGLGLGLCGLKIIADDFRLESRPGQGTRVFVTVWSNATASS